MDYEPMKHDEMDSDTRKGIGQLKKNINKKMNPVRKIIAHAIKTVITTMAIKMLPIIICIITITTLIAGFQLILDGDEESKQEEILDAEYSGTVSDGNYVVDLSQPNALPKLTKEQLAKAINSKYTGEARNNYVSVLDDLIYIQDTYNVNAAFAIAVAQQESCGGTAWKAIARKTYNWMSLSGYYNGRTYRNPASTNTLTWRVYNSFGEATRDFGYWIANSDYYFKNGKFTVEAIGEVFCPGETWSNPIKDSIKDIYAKAGIEINNGVSEYEEGYDENDDVSTVTLGGRTYKNYKQGTYKGIKLAHTEDNNTIASHGCAITAVAIIATGYGRNVTPIDVNNYYCTLSGIYHNVGLNHYTGLKCGYVKREEVSDIKQGIISQLKRGIPVLIHVEKNSGKFKTSFGHFFAILAINESGDQVYVSDPATKNMERNGWLPITILDDKAIDKYMKME